MPFVATWTEPEIVIPSEVSQTRERQIYKTAYVWNQKKWYK